MRTLGFTEVKNSLFQHTTHTRGFEEQVYAFTQNKLIRFIHTVTLNYIAI